MTLVAPRKPTASHHVRSGRHQHHRKHFAKTYWPYLPMLFIVGLCLAVNSLWASTSHHVLGASSNLTATSLLSLTNQQRKNDHEASLSLNDQLNQAAQAKANDMVSRNYWSHNSPDGTTPWAFITSAGYNYQLAGENLAYGFSDASGVISGWMNSSEHRANILNQGYSQVGFGTASNQDYQNHGPAIVVVAMYAEPAPASQALATTPNGTVAPELSSRPLASQPVARVQLLTNSSEWSLLAVIAVAGAGVMIVALRHARYWQKALAKSEVFVIKHPLLDIALISLAAISVTLGQAAGYIQ